MSIEESGIGRWSRLKKARKDRAVSRSEPKDSLHKDQQVASRGKAAPVAYPTEVSGEYRPWLPPLTAEKEENVPVETENEQGQEGGASPEEILNEEEAAIAEEMNLPDIETLEEESDFSAFLKDGVPEKLRRLALRKLWASNPLFGFRDGLNDYDEDFTALSDYVYNSVAMKEFTGSAGKSDVSLEEETNSQPEDQSENQHDGKIEENQGAGDSSSDPGPGEGGHESENVPESIDESMDTASPDYTSSADDDDPELG